jgi:hypothetical protein
VYILTTFALGGLLFLVRFPVTMMGWICMLAEILVG